MTLRAVIYDLDGTLIDSRDDLADSVNAMLSRLDLPTHEPGIIQGFIGEGAERLIRRSLGAHEERYPEAAPVWREEYERRLLSKTRLYDGIGAVLREEPSRRAVLTNKPGRYAREILQGLGVAAAFVEVLGGDEMPRKPSPDGLLGMLVRLQVTPADAILVGDSTVDLATARAAGVRFCAVTWGLGARAALESADYICDAPAGLQRLYARLRSD